MNIIDAVCDPKVFGPSFPGDTWRAWIALLGALFALPMTPEQLALYRKHTGRVNPPAAPFLEAWLIIGRRGGKSLFMALVAVFLAFFKDWRPYLGVAGIGPVMVIASDRRQARAVFRAAIALIKSVPMLARQVEGVTMESITLKNGIIIEIHTASYKSVRGYNIVGALVDEVAQLPTDESATPDSELINALKPAMATIPGAMLLCGSSPYAQRGALWDAYRKHYGKDGDRILVWKATTRDMNPSVPQSYIDAHMADDPAAASAEYFAEFRSDLQTFIDREATEACVDVGVYERPPSRVESHVGFVDMSGGSIDPAALCIAHLHVASEVVVIDCLREIVAPHSPEAAAAEFSDIIKSYGLAECYGDRFAAGWPVAVFERFGVTYIACAKVKNDLYLGLLPPLNSGRLRLLDHQKCLNQLIGLERHTARGGKDRIDHAPHRHDDLINALAAAAAQVISPGGYFLDA